MVRRRFVEYFPSLVCLVEPSLEALFLLPVIVLKSSLLFNISLGGIIYASALASVFSVSFYLLS